MPKLWECDGGRCEVCVNSVLGAGSFVLEKSGMSYEVRGTGCSVLGAGQTLKRP